MAGLYLGYVMTNSLIKEERRASAAAHEAKALWRKHVKGCSDCHRADRDSNPYLYCPNGWELVKDYTRTHHEHETARERRKSGAIVGQGGLF